MNRDACIAVCRALPGTTEDLKWGCDRVFSVGGKMYCVLPDDRQQPCRISLKVDGYRFLELTDLPGVIPAPYLARAQWVALHAGCVLPQAEIAALIQRSHALVLSKLSKRLREQIAAGL